MAWSCEALILRPTSLRRESQKSMGGKGSGSGDGRVALSCRMKRIRPMHQSHVPGSDAES